MNTNQPVWKLNQGSLAAAAWLNQRKGPNGIPQERLSVTVERRYKDERTDQWKTSHSYSAYDLLVLRHFLGRVIDRAIETETQERGDAA